MKLDVEGGRRRPITLSPQLSPCYHTIILCCCATVGQAATLLPHVLLLSPWHSLAFLKMFVYAHDCDHAHDHVSMFMTIQVRFRSSLGWNAAVSEWLIE